MLFYFASDLSKIDQTWSKWIQMDQNGFSPIKTVIIKSCHIYRKDRNDCFLFDFLYQICRYWIKLDQTFWPDTAFWQSWLFFRNFFSSKNTCVNFEVTFWLKKAFFKKNLPFFSKYWKVWLAFMAESFQARFFQIQYQ